MPPPSSVRQPALARGAQQLGLQRAVDDLGDPEVARRSSAGVDRAARVGGHAGRRRVHEPVGALEEVAGARACAASRGRRAWRRAPPRARASASTTVERPGAERRRSACATAAPAPPAPSSTTRSVAAPGRPRRKLCLERGPVGVVAAVAVAVEEDRVHRAERLGLRRERVERAGTTSCLHGCVTFRPAKPRAGPRRTSSRTASGGDAVLVEVDQLVRVRQARARAASRSCSAGLSEAPIAGAHEPDH